MKICIITSTRAEYGLLKNFIKNIRSSSKFKLQLIVTGTHLSSQFGKTLNEIKDDNIQNFYKINILDKKLKNKEVHPSSILANTILKFSKFFKLKKPDLVVVLGDRFELIGICSSAAINKIPICHFHGGESTHGLIDDVVRHAVTKFSHIHFTSHQIYKKRILQLGENPKYVYNIGGLGAENLNKIKLLKKNELEKKIKFKFIKNTCLFTFHPETLSKLKIKEQLNGVMKVLNNKKDLNIIFTYPNIDPGHSEVIKIIKDFHKQNKNRSILVKSFGSLLYYSTLNNIDFVIGNSSSGLLEVPSFNIPTINIGTRQDGRLRNRSVIDCDYKYSSILNSVNKALSKSFKNSIKKDKNLYFQKNSSFNALRIIEKINLKKLLIKKFYDIN